MGSLLHLLALALTLTVGYAAISIYAATQVVHSKHVPIYATPASLGLQYKDITFLSREDHIQLSGWFIPGVLPNGNLTAQRTIGREEKVMSTHALNETKGAVQEHASEPKRSAWRGALVGLIPLGLLAGMVAITLLVTALARQLTAGSGFFVQQQTALIALIVGLALAIVVYTVAIWRVLRRVKSWQPDGTTTRANAALWALTTTALMSVLPVLLALILPQHAAPCCWGNVFKGIGAIQPLPYAA